MNQLLAASETAWVRDRALAAGFDACSVAPARNFQSFSLYSEWLKRGYAGEMKYLQDPRRSDPQNSMPGVRSLIVAR